MTTITGSTGVTTPTTYVNPVASSTTLSGLSSTAAKLGQDSSVIATLGGSTSTTPLYNAVGLLNSIIDAGANNTAQNDNSTSSTTGTTGSGSTTTGANDTTTGTSTSTGSSTGATNINSNWATLLKANPALAGTVAADSTLQGIVSTISTTA